MNIKHFVFSYTNILKREIYRKRYFSFCKKIINIFYKLITNLLKKKIGLIINLDKKKDSKYFNSSLSELFKNFNCDKGYSMKIEGNKILKTHNYTPFYEKYFKIFKNKKIKILELGSHEGKGIASFYYFFPNARLIGANINPFQMKYYSNRIEEIFIDVSSKKILQSFCNYIDINFDLIIDDASHNLRDILITLPIVFKKLKSGGYYVIEDINQFEVFKNLNPSNEKLTPLKILKLIQSNEKFNSPFLSEKDTVYLKENIEDFIFEKGEMQVNGYNISDIVFLKKK